MSQELDQLAASFGDNDAQVDLSDTLPEAWLALLLFFALGLTVFYQFITRYVFNDSAAWTEEVARYLLIGTVFTGAVIGVTKTTTSKWIFSTVSCPPLCHAPCPCSPMCYALVFWPAPASSPGC